MPRATQVFINTPVPRALLSSPKKLQLTLIVANHVFWGALTPGVGGGTREPITNEDFPHGHGVMPVAGTFPRVWTNQHRRFLDGFTLSVVTFST